MKKYAYHKKIISTRNTDNAEYIQKLTEVTMCTFGDEISSSERLRLRFLDIVNPVVPFKFDCISEN